MATDMATLQKTFGERVRERRETLQWSQSDLAKIIGMRQSSVSDIETGQHAPTLETVERIAKALKVDPADLLS